jgi:hypothetical protein
MDIAYTDFSGFPGTFTGWDLSAGNLELGFNAYRGSYLSLNVRDKSGFDVLVEILLDDEPVVQVSGTPYVSAKYLFF